MYLYVVRHGETLFNKLQRMQGWCDSPLTEKGIQQAKDTGVKLKDIDFVHAYSSTSERAVDTLDYILGDRNIPKKALKGLKEFNFGTLEAEKQDYVHNVLKVPHSEMYKYGGDRIEDLVERMENQLLEIARNHPEGNVLCVSHGGVFINVLRHLAPDYIEDRFRRKLPIMENCQILLFESDGKTLKFIKNDL
ncbi:MAG: histidine phosphatase family protein [Holdemanella sp.]|nr:histidine phosphatase family protein [Holdemanella sp.]